MKTFTVKVFTGECTRVYIIKDTNIFSAENKALKYHTGIGEKIIKVETIQNL